MLYLLSENLHKYMKEETMCDVTLVSGVDGKKIPVHRLILCASSDFFHSLFIIDKQHKNEIKIEGIKGEVLEIVIDFFYTGIIANINEDNIRDLLAAASFFTSKSLEEKCTEYFTKAERVNDSKCVEIWTLAHLYDIFHLKEVAPSYEQMGFVKTEKILKLEKVDFQLIIENDGIVVDSEEVMFNAVVDWINFDLVKRKAMFPEFVQAVRMNLLSNKFILQNVLAACHRYERKETFLKLSLMKFRDMDPNELPSTCSTFYDLLAIDRTKSGPIERYSQGSKEWIRYNHIQVNRILFEVELIDNDTKLIIIGGALTGSEFTGSVSSVNLNTNQFSELEPMIAARCYHSLVTMYGFIYAVGGFNVGTSINNVERYDIKLNQWTEVAPMQFRRSSHATVHLSGKLYSIGGAYIGKALRSVESYDPIENKWTAVASMVHRREYARAGVVKGLIYVIGSHETIESYDATTNTWTLINFQLNLPRMGFGLTVMNDWIILAGLGKNDLKTCEKINVITGEREDMASLLEPIGNCSLVSFHNNSED